MAVDIYLRNSTDPTFEEGRTEIGEGLDRFLQQIEMVLLTPKGSILGLPDFGASLELFLWQFNVNANQLENEVIRQITLYCSLATNFDFTARAQVFENEGYQDTAVLDIAINGMNILGLQIK